MSGLRISIALILSVGGFLSSGCTNMYYSGLKAPGSGLSAATAGGGLLGATSSVCNGIDPNVLPDYDPYGGTFGQYQVCPRDTSSSDITIGVVSATTTAICVFPVAFSTTTTVPYIPDPTRANLPMYQCMRVLSGVAYASFPNVKYNGVYIIENLYDSNRRMSYLEEMLGCLQANNPITCPYYSEGSF